jgi:hypothetical protein
LAASAAGRRSRRLHVRLHLRQVPAVRPPRLTRQRQLRPRAHRLSLVPVLRSDARFLPSLERLDHGDRVRWREVLVVVVRVSLHAVGVVRDGDHRRVDAAAHALHLPEREQAIRRGLEFLHAHVVTQRLFDVPRAAKHARGGAAHHDVVLANLGAVEHGVERGHLVHADGRHLEHLRHPVHGLHREVALVRLLRHVEQRDHGGALVVGRVALQDLVHDGHGGLGEVPVEGIVVVGGVAMLFLGRRWGDRGQRRARGGAGLSLKERI